MAPPMTSAIPVELTVRVRLRLRVRLRVRVRGLGLGIGLLGSRLGFGHACGAEGRHEGAEHDGRAQDGHAPPARVGDGVREGVEHEEGDEGELVVRVEACGRVRVRVRVRVRARVRVRVSARR